MRKDKCPYCEQDISFRTKMKIDPRYKKKCPHCNKKIGMPYWSNFPFFLICVILVWQLESWIIDNQIVSIILLAILVLINAVITTLYIPIVGRED